MGNLTRSGARTWTKDEDADLIAMSEAMQQSIDDNLLAKFPTPQARATGETGGNGSVSYLASDGGLYLLQNSAFLRLLVAGDVIRWGRTDDKLEDNGMLRIKSEFCFFGTTAPTTILCFSAMGAAFHFGFDRFDGGGALIKVMDLVQRTYLQPGAAAACFWVSLR